MIVTFNGASSAPFPVTLIDAAPGVFTIPPGEGTAVVVTESGVIAGAVGAIEGVETRPAARGEVLLVYATGLGAVTPEATSGDNSEDQLRRTTEEPEVLIGGEPAEVLFSGLSPQFVGVYQLNVRASEGTPGGSDIPVQIRMNDITSPPVATIAVQDGGTFTSDPISTFGHGSFLSAGGRAIKPDAAFIESAQDYYLQTILSDPAVDRLEAGRVEEARGIINELVDDPIIANALYIDWLLDQVDMPGETDLAAKNSALRWRYVLELQTDPVLPNEQFEWTKGVDPEAAERLVEEGIGVVKVPLKTEAGGAQYIADCRAAGVPIPPPMYGPGWTKRGEVTDEFISEALRTELWLHESASPPGVCLALPRYEAGSNEAQLFGLICLGTQSSKACFWDNPRRTLFQENVLVDIDQMLGGFDLDANMQGTCTDCHAGENPFVVHPDKPPFQGFAAQPLAWYEPLVHPTWPQNPGPSNILDAITSTGRCDSCHRAGVAGRFPDVSTALNGYCTDVLRNATGPLPKRTMPRGGADPAPYANHRDALVAACTGPPMIGTEVDVTQSDDPAFVSPPLVIGPLYACATKVAVRGAKLDAKVSVFVNGTEVASISPARSPHQVEIDVPALKADDIVTAKQDVAGVLSGESPEVQVRDHRVDYPAGLPAPTVDPTLIYQCGSTIAVRHIPGATLTVFSNGGSPRSFVTSTGWTAVTPGKSPFDLGDKFTASVALCEDSNGPSAAEQAVAPPTTVPGPTLNPPTTYNGQELVSIENIVNGALVSVAESTAGPLGDFSTPVSWFPDYDVASRLGRPMTVSDGLTVSQRLCAAGPVGETQIERPVEDCSALPAPRIQHPVVGQNFVVVNRFVPGAHIRVYDQNGVELGDGAGSVIILRRALAGADTIVVVQQVGRCTSRTGYQVSVRNPG